MRRSTKITFAAALFVNLHSFAYAGMTCPAELGLEDECAKIETGTCPAFIVSFVCSRVFARTGDIDKFMNCQQSLCTPEARAKGDAEQEVIPTGSATLYGVEATCAVQGGATLKYSLAMGTDGSLTGGRHAECWAFLVKDLKNRKATLCTEGLQQYEGKATVTGKIQSGPHAGRSPGALPKDLEATLCCGASLYGQCQPVSKNEVAKPEPPKPAAKPVIERSARCFTSHKYVASAELGNYTASRCCEKVSAEKGREYCIFDGFPDSLNIAGNINWDGQYFTGECKVDCKPYRPAATTRTPAKGGRSNTGAGNR